MIKSRSVGDKCIFMFQTYIFLRIEDILKSLSFIIENFQD